MSDETKAMTKKERAKIDRLLMEVRQIGVKSLDGYQIATAIGEYLPHALDAIDHLEERAEKAERERDEAREKVDRLRAQADDWHASCDECGWLHKHVSSNPWTCGNCGNEIQREKK